MMKNFTITFFLFSLLGLSAFAAQDNDAETGVFLVTVTIGALDKVTARTSEITFKIGEPVKVGSLVVMALRAWKANIEEQPEAKVFLKITEYKTSAYKLDINEEKAKDTKKHPPVVIFQGWMFASIPSVNSLVHPIYDIWIKTVSGEKNKGALKENPPLDQETSERIDDLIDQLLETDDNYSSFKNIPDVVNRSHAYKL